MDSRANFVTTHRHLLTVGGIGSIVGVGLALAIISRPSSTSEASLPEDATLAAPSRPDAAGRQTDIELTPDGPKRSTPPPERRPESGTDLQPGSATGQGALAGRNDTASDPVIVLTSRDGLRRSLYLRRGEKFTLLDVAPASYGMRVLLGRNWGTAAFAQPAAFLELDQPLEIEAVQAGDPVQTVALRRPRPDSTPPNRSRSTRVAIPPSSRHGPPQLFQGRVNSASATRMASVARSTASGGTP
jgi:hypothetical protein